MSSILCSNGGADMHMRNVNRRVLGNNWGDKHYMRPHTLIYTNIPATWDVVTINVGLAQARSNYWMGVFKLQYPQDVSHPSIKLSSCTPSLAMLQRACNKILIFRWQRRSSHRKTKAEMQYHRSYHFTPLWEWKKLRFSLSFSGILDHNSILAFIVRHWFKCCRIPGQIRNRTVSIIVQNGLNFLSNDEEHGLRFPTT